MKFIVMPKKTVSLVPNCGAECENNCALQCGTLGKCFCPLDR